MVILISEADKSARFYWMQTKKHRAFC